MQVKFEHAGRHSVEFAEEWGQLFNLAVFFLFGLLVARAWPEFHGLNWLYAIISLTVVRMVPVAISLIGTRLSPATVIFMGWFGPRGLASVVFAIIVLDAHVPNSDTLAMMVACTVILSVVAHGVTANPLAKAYGMRARREGEG